MEKTVFLKATVMVLFLAGFAFAGCSENAYRSACSSCSFDANGRIDQQCMSAQKSGGIACVSSSYPLMAAEYAQGKCPQVDQCASDLQACLSQVGSGNDRADCAEGSATTCYATSDICVRQAAAKCPPQQPCQAPAALIMLVIGGVFLAGFVRKE